MAKKIDNYLDFFVLLTEDEKNTIKENIVKMEFSDEDIKRALIEVFYEILEKKSHLKLRYYN